MAINSWAIQPPPACIKPSQRSCANFSWLSHSGGVTRTLMSNFVVTNNGLKVMIHELWPNVTSKSLDHPKGPWFSKILFNAPRASDFHFRKYINNAGVVISEYHCKSETSCLLGAPDPLSLYVHHIKNSFGSFLRLLAPCFTLLTRDTFHKKKHSLISHSFQQQHFQVSLCRCITIFRSWFFLHAQHFLTHLRERKHWANNTINLWREWGKLSHPLLPPWLGSTWKWL